jgi:hypothetical protein
LCQSRVCCNVLLGVVIHQCLFRCAVTGTSWESACRDRQSCLLAKSCSRCSVSRSPHASLHSTTSVATQRPASGGELRKKAMDEEKKFWSNGFDELQHPLQTLSSHDPCTNSGPWVTPDAWACVGAEWMMCPETWEQPYKQWSPPSGGGLAVRLSCCRPVLCRCSATMNCSACQLAYAQ